MTIDIDEIERIAKAGDPWGYAATPANVLELIAEVRRLRAELNDFITDCGDLNQEVVRLREENAVCRNAIEDAVDMVDACASTYDDDGSQGALRATKRQLSEAIGKACPRLMMERADGQKLYGLHWRELNEEVRGLREDLQAAKLLAHSNAEMFGAEKADGDRYRWLKAHWGHRTPILNGLKPDGVVDDAFDAGIDTAIARGAE
ncbi:hypothetical protein WCQ02_31135 [Paraburkholderia tropica]|uniref:hypothetical protein n=1 Tax=Paraburkholderia tropica TaxID=92647 RepID=UPI00301954D8